MHRTSPDPERTQAARDWIARLASGEMTEAELERYHLWAAEPDNEQVFQHEIKLWRSLDAIADRLAPQPAPAAARPSMRRGGVAFAVAACLMLMMSGPEF